MPKLTGGSRLTLTYSYTSLLPPLTRLAVAEPLGIYGCFCCESAHVFFLNTRVAKLPGAGAN